MKRLTNTKKEWKYKKAKNITYVPAIKYKEKRAKNAETLKEHKNKKSKKQII